MVYNLSAMTEAEAAATVCGTESSLPCVRFSRMSDGRVRTTDRRPLPRVVLTGGLLAAAAATAALSSQEDPAEWLWSRVEPMELMGEPGVLEVPVVSAPEGNIPEADSGWQDDCRPPITGKPVMPDRSAR